MRTMPNSQVVLTDADIVAAVRERVAAENIGQPRQWTEEAEQAAQTEIDKALADRAALQAIRQAEYDAKPPVVEQPGAFVSLEEIEAEARALAAKDKAE